MTTNDATRASAEAMTNVMYTVDDLDSGLNHLNDLISVICELTFELPLGETDNRISSLLWIARDLSEGLVDFQNRKYGIGRYATEGGAA